MAAGREEQIKQFCEVTGETEDRAKFFLEASGWDVQMAQETYFDQSSGKSDSTHFSQSQPPPSSSSGKVARLSDFGQHDEKDDDREKFFAGGSEHSGQYITGPARQTEGDVSGDELVKNVFTAAKSYGTVVDDKASSGGVSSFVGAGFRLGDSEGPSEQVTPSVVAPPPEAHRVLYFWKNGFSIDSGPLRDNSTDDDREFLKSVMKGEIPQELLSAARGGKVELTMEDRRSEDYNPPKPKMVAFTGEGHTLGNIAPALVEEQQQVAPPTKKSTADGSSSSINVNQPVTRIQIKLSDGSRMTAQFNHTHTVADIRTYINEVRPDLSKNSYILKTTFPNKELIDETVTIATANLINAVVVQHPK